MSTHNQNKHPVSVSDGVIIAVLLFFAIAGFGSIPSVMHAYNQVDVTMVLEDN